MKNGTSKTGRREFVTRGLALGTFLGIGCPALLSPEQHNFQKASGFTYQQVFNFTFRGWFISYLRELQKLVGKEKILKLLIKAGESHYRKSVGPNFAKIKDKSVKSLIENFWEPITKSKFGTSTIAIKILDKAPRKGTLKMTQCLFAKTFVEAKAADIGYAAICNADFAVTEEFNPKIILTRDKCLMKGDDCCLFKYSMKG
jgi:hypothetical protein